MIAPKKRNVRCAVPGCNEKAGDKGLCVRHYNRALYRRKAELPIGDLPDGWPCPICGERLANLSTHMSRHHGIRLTDFYREHGILCSVPGCDRLAVVRGKCKKHRALERSGKLWL